MIDLANFKLKPTVKVIGKITHVGSVKSVGKTQVIDVAMTAVYGSDIKASPYTCTIVFQANDFKTQKKDAQSGKYVDADSFVKQFETNPLKAGDCVEATLEIGGYHDEVKLHTFAKVTLKKLWRYKSWSEDETTIQNAINLASI